MIYLHKKKTMAFLNKYETITAKSELDLFTVPSTQISIESGQIKDYRPISSILPDCPIEFNVPHSGSEYIDQSHTQLYILAKVTKEDGTDLTNTDNVAPINNWLHSMFSQVEIILNQKNASSSANLYHYRAYIETLLSYGKYIKAYKSIIIYIKIR